MTMIEDRLDTASQDVRQATAAMPTRPVGHMRVRHRRQQVAMSVAVGAVITAGFLAVGQATDVGPGQTPTEPPSVAATAPPAEDTTPDTTVPVVEQSAVAEFWGGWLAISVDSVSKWGTYGPDQPEPEARVVESSSEGGPLADGGSLTATVVTAGEQLTVTAEFQSYMEVPDPQTALEREIATIEAAGSTEHVDTYWFGADPESKLADEGERTEFFLTELESGGQRLTALSALGQLVVDSEAADPAVQFDKDQLMGIASGMAGTAFELIWDPDHPLSLEVWEPPAPTDEQWIALDEDLWIAWVSEGDSERLWVKSDIQEPTAAAATDMRSLFAYAGDDFVVIVLGDPVPDAVTVTWEGGATDTGQVEWNDELDMGFVRFVDQGVRPVSVDGP